MSEILVADDNPANLSVILRFLELLGHSGHSAANGREAVSKVKSGAYDLVLMDCQMPELDGYEATRQIRAVEREAGQTAIPIIALTANALSADREKCREAGMSDFLTKPVHLKHLGRTIAAWLGDEEGLIENAERPEDAEPAAELPDEPCVDMQYLVSLSELQKETKEDGKPDLLGELLEHFKRSGPEIAQQIRTGLQTNELEQVRKSAHLFKSTCHHVGARKLASICESIEHRSASAGGGAERLGGIMAMLVDQLEREYSTALRELESFVKISA